MKTKKHFRLLAVTVLGMIGLQNTALAENKAHLIAPSCFLKTLNVPYKIVAQHQDLRLIETDEALVEKLAEQKAHHGTPCGGFINISQEFTNDYRQTNFWSRFENPTASTLKTTSSYKIQYEKEVENAFKNLNPQSMWDNLTTLTANQDRYANSELGVKAAHWLKTQVEDLAKKYNRQDVSVSFVNTGNYKQPSVVAKIGNQEGPGIVIGAHMDTLSSNFSHKPGADDDGSGTVTVLETLRTLFASNMQFKKPVYFIWYAAEEMGLVGSRYVVSDFKKKNIPVDAVIHFDMTGYVVRNESTMWLISDNVNKDLTSYLETLINTYVKQPVKYTRCGYACSDHASWTFGGFKAAMPAETAFSDSNPNLHTARDTMDKLSLAHMTDYAKLGVAFVIELAEPVSA